MKKWIVTMCVNVNDSNVVETYVVTGDNEEDATNFAKLRLFFKYKGKAVGFTINAITCNSYI
jgi:hypothetical protein